MSLSWNFVPSSITTILRFYLFIVFQISWMDFVKFFLDLALSLTDLSFLLWYLQWLRLSLLSTLICISCSLPRFFTSWITSVCVFFIALFPFSGLEYFYSFLSTVFFSLDFLGMISSNCFDWLFLDFLKRFIHFPLWTSIIFIKLVLMLFSGASAVVGSGGDILH